MPTRDGSSFGRWVAADESGWNGEDLYRPGDPYFVIGSVAIDDETAAPLVEDLRRAAGISQAIELKFRHFTNSDRRLHALAEFLDSGGPLADRTGIYLTDKRYFVTAKIIDLLLEEHSHARGVDLYADDKARKIAWNFFNEGPRALGREQFDHLIGIFVEFARSRNRRQSSVSVDELFDALNSAFSRSTRRRISDLLLQLLKTREEAEDLLKRMNAEQFLEALEPLYPVAAAVINVWSARLGSMSLLMDEQNVLTDDRFDIVERNIKRGLTEFRHLWRNVQLRDLARGKSVDHPSIQLADLVAGAEGCSSPLRIHPFSCIHGRRNNMARNRTAHLGKKAWFHTTIRLLSQSLGWTDGT